jgi:hypothetical protein
MLINVDNHVILEWVKTALVVEAKLLNEEIKILFSFFSCWLDINNPIFFSWSSAGGVGLTVTTKIR